MAHTKTSIREPLDHARVPYADALRHHASQDPLMFMVPGHAATPDGISADLAEFIGERTLRFDVPQMVEGIDAGEKSPLAESLRLAADAWGARRSWFLANGSSQGNRMAVIGAVAGGEGTTILAQRSAHSSLLDGLVVTGATPRWIAPELDHTFGINHGLTPEALADGFAAAAERGEQPCAAYVISPSYFGAVSDIAGLAEVAHANGVPLIVDAAWGAHLGFSSLLPDFPTARGADIVVTSTHKMGGSLGQSSMLHLGHGPYAAALEPALERAFHLTQTTSVSSLLFASLDIARRSLMRGGSAIAESVVLADGLRDAVRAHPSLTLVSDTFDDFASIAEADPLRVSIGVADTAVSGYELRAELARDHSILLEIATSQAVVAFLGPGKDLDTERLMAAIDEVLAKPRVAAQNGAAQIPPLPGPGRRVLTPREAFFAASEIVPAEQAVGRVSADALAAYPPGIPNIAPGEEITAEALRFLRAVAASPNGLIRGALDPAVNELRVVRD